MGRSACLVVVIGVACGGEAQQDERDWASGGGTGKQTEGGATTAGGAITHGGEPSFGGRAATNTGGRSSGSRGGRSGTGCELTGGAEPGGAGSGGAGDSGAGAGGMVGGGGSNGGTGGRDEPGGGGAFGGGGEGGRTEVPLCFGRTHFAGFNYCSEQQACAKLDCGRPWSLYDATGCRRPDCSEGETCPLGTRCVHAAVAGNFDKTCFGDFDGCDSVNGACACFPYECMALAVCLPLEEFSEEQDCPVEDLDCDGLARAAAGLDAYRHELLAEDTSTEVAACEAKVASLRAHCL